MGITVLKLSENPMTLQEAIDFFVQDNSYLADQREAYCQCESASELFIALCNEHGITGINKYTFCLYNKATFRSRCDKDNPDPDMFPPQAGTHVETNEAGQHMADWHCIVETPEFLIDFTARQYRASAPYPFIIPKDAIGKKNALVLYAQGGAK